MFKKVVIADSLAWRVDYCFDHYADLDGGTLFSQFSHFKDIMYWLFCDIKNIQGKFNDFTHKESTDFEDSGFVNFDFIVLNNTFNP